MKAQSLPKAADADYLTEALRRCGVLPAGRVREVIDESSRDHLVSRVVRLRLAYEGDSRDAPGSLILKTPLPGLGLGHGLYDPGKAEVAFYSTVAAAMPAVLVPRCFDAAWQAKTGTETANWHLLLEDLTDTHAIATVWPLPPSEAQCRAIVGMLARFHAAWWDDVRLGVSVGTWVDDETARQYLQHFAGFYRSFADRLGDRLSAERRALYERYFATPPPAVRARYRTRRNMTVIHGDAHVWNFFLPKDESVAGNTMGARLFDWDTWRLGFATTDLAYMMATHWYPERRRQLERPLLDHYHGQLVAAGVQGYDRSALDDDYRLAVLMQMVLPVLQAEIGIPPAVWWSHVERIFLAIDDLGCHELLG